MKALVQDPPGDFDAEHAAISRPLEVQEVSLTPAALVGDGDGLAHVGFTIKRTLSHGTWTYASTLRLARRHGDWKVAWALDTLYPGLQPGATWSLDQITASSTVAVARDGTTLPADSTVQAYLPELATSYGSDDTDQEAWAITLHQPGRAGTQRVKILGTAPAGGGKLRTTIDRKLQAAADAAVHGSPKPAAVVAVRPSTGEILAVGDTLGARNAFLGLYPPGSTFKVITAAALVSNGYRPGTAVACPHQVQTGGRTITNDEGLDLGGTSLTQAFAHSCNTTFAQLTVDRLDAGKLDAVARIFGFGLHIAPGVTAYEGDFPKDATGPALPEAAIGQGTVQASPLAMALVAGAVENGTWRPPRLVPAKALGRGEASAAHAVPHSLLGPLRSMMRAVVTGGTASRAGLPGGVAGKTGTAEIGDGHSHAWFVGYRGDLAFAVFVKSGESGPKVAAPLAAKFLNAR
jgi:hypothetical protein